MIVTGISEIRLTKPITLIGVDKESIGWWASTFYGSCKSTPMARFRPARPVRESTKRRQLSILSCIMPSRNDDFNNFICPLRCAKLPTVIGHVRRDRLVSRVISVHRSASHAGFSTRSTAPPKIINAMSILTSTAILLHRLELIFHHAYRIH